MRKSIIKRAVSLLCLGCILVSVMAMSGCGSFFAEEELIISSVEHKKLEDGSVQITISYVDDVKAPDVFVLPKGETGDEGAEGNGIASIVPTYDDENRKTVLTVNYTDETTETFEVPYGVSIAEIQGPFEDKIAEKLYIQLLYTNGDVSEPIYIEKPKDGVGIKNIETVDNEDGSKYVIITLTDDRKIGEKETDRIIIPAPERGVGVADITTGYNESGTQYYLEVTYTDPDMEKDYFWFDRPTAWFSGQGTPDSSLGIIGDLYFDTLYSRIYAKTENGWLLKTMFTHDLESCIVTFYYNYEDNGQEGAESVTIKKGYHLAGSGYDVPVPTREGYTFAGWYTSRNPNLTVAGGFTDLTVVYNNMSLYARWEPINP